MSKQHSFDVRMKRIQTNLRPYIPSAPVLAAGTLLILGAGFLVILPNKDDAAPLSIAANSGPAAVTPDEALCDRQAWPYMDQRCAARVDAARGSRQVTIVTDKGTSVKTITPLPVVEKKAASQPQPAVARVSPQIGPSVAPMAGGQSSEPQTTASAAPPPVGTKAMASANVSPVSASTAPPSPGVEALDETHPKSKSERAGERAQRLAKEKAQKREAKRLKRELEREGIPQEVVDAVRGVSNDRSRNARAEVPDEVIDAVESAARDRGRIVNVESPRGRRVYVVPRDGGW